MSRWIRATVDLLDHEILAGPYDRRSAWLWLIAHAAWKDKRISHKGRPLELKRGQVLAGRAFLAETWGWGEKQVRIFLDLLAAENMIEKGQSNGHFANVITISNYEKYQSVEKGEQPEEGPEQGQCAASAGPEQGQTLTSTTISTNNSELARERVEKQITKTEHDELSRELHEACGPALANEAVAPGLMSLAVPYGWLRHGADLKTMIVPALKARSARCSPGSIRSWDYFSAAVAEAKAKQDAGLPVVEIRAPRPGGHAQPKRRTLTDVLNEKSGPAH